MYIQVKLDRYELIRSLSRENNMFLIDLIRDLDENIDDWHFTINLIVALLSDIPSEDIMEGYDTIKRIFAKHKLEHLIGEP